MNDLVSRLDGVKQTGASRWIARCPAHDDRSPSLAVRELDDGRWLIHCFAGCGGADVMGAIGLELSDLYPEPLKHHSAPARPNHYHAAREALRTLHYEVLLIAIAAENVVNKIILSEKDRDRLILSARRVRSVAEAVR